MRTDVSLATDPELLKYTRLRSPGARVAIFSDKAAAVG